MCMYGRWKKYSELVKAVNDADNSVLNQELKFQERILLFFEHLGTKDMSTFTNGPFVAVQ